MDLDQDAAGRRKSIADPLVILVLMSISLFGNSLLIISRAVTAGRRVDTFNIYMISMAAFGLLECSLTMSLATGFSIEKEWIFGDFLMGFNCCFTQLQNIGVFLTISAMSADRYIVVCKLMGRRQTSVNQANFTVVYTWFHAFAISLPLLLYRESKLDLRPFVDRNLCGLSEGATTAYTWVVIVSSFLVPSLITLFCLLAVFSATVKKCRTSTSCFTKYYLHESDVGIQMRYATYTLLLFILYLAFKLPYVINDLVTQLSPAENKQKPVVAYDTKNPDRTTDFLQTALVWLMFCFSTVYPVVTFAWFADHKRGLFASLCHHTRLKLLAVRSKTDTQVADQSSPSSQSNSANGKASSERKWCRGRVQSLSKENSGTEMTSISAEVGFQVPVLYATSDGLHLMETGPKSNQADLITDLQCAEVGDFLRSDGSAFSDSGKRFVPGTTFSRFMETGDGATCEPRSSSILSKDTVKSSLDSQIEHSCRCSGSETSLLRLSGNSRTLLLPNFRMPVDLQYGSATSLPQKAAWDTLPDPWCSFLR